MTPPTPEKRLAGFVAKFTPEMAARIRAARAKMRKRIPRAHELVYDNYNFFVIGYGPSEKAKDAIFSLAAQASGLSLCFLQGAKLPEPSRLLRGSGSWFETFDLIPQKPSIVPRSPPSSLQRWREPRRRYLQQAAIGL